MWVSLNRYKYCSVNGAVEKCNQKLKIEIDLDLSQFSIPSSEFFTNKFEYEHICEEISKGREILQNFRGTHDFMNKNKNFHDLNDMNITNNVMNKFIDKIKETLSNLESRKNLYDHSNLEKQKL